MQPVNQHTRARYEPCSTFRGKYSLNSQIIMLLSQHIQNLWSLQYFSTLLSEGGVGCRAIRMKKSSGCLWLHGSHLSQKEIYMLLQKACIKRLGGEHAPPAAGCCSGHKLLCSAKTRYRNDRLLLVLLSQKVIIKFLPCPSQLVLSASHLQKLSQRFWSTLYEAVPFGLA